MRTKRDIRRLSFALLLHSTLHTVSVDPLDSGTSTWSGLFLISLSLIPLSCSTKSSKRGEEEPWSTFVFYLQNSSLLGFGFVQFGTCLHYYKIQVPMKGRQKRIELFVSRAHHYDFVANNDITAEQFFSLLA